MGTLDNRPERHKRLGSRDVPLIGLSTYSQDAQWGNWERPAALLPTAYIEMVAQAGGRPILLPPFDAGGGTAGAYGVIGALDGLVLVGGEDVDPARYGQQPGVNIGRVNQDRDSNELTLLSAAMDCDLGVLAICRGHQLLNVYLGGTLIQHMPDSIDGPTHQPKPGLFQEISIEAVAGSRVAKSMGERFNVLCSHHQCIDRLADGLVVTATSVQDGVIEAVEMQSKDFVVGVQWHPEESGDFRLFSALVEALRS